MGDEIETVTDLQVPSISAAEAMEGRFQVVDVRSPCEFADGHMPGAVNFPLLDDAQRAAVGVAYKEEGAAQARLRGYGAGERRRCPITWAGWSVWPAPSGRVAGWPSCAGGAGSGAETWRLLLALVGVHAVTVAAGYRAYRREVLRGWRDGGRRCRWSRSTATRGPARARLSERSWVGPLATTRPPREPAPGWSTWRRWRCIEGRCWAGLNQPGERRQKDFDALLWDRLRHPGGDYLVLEGEGGKIGRLFLPASVAEAIRTGLPVLVTASVGGARGTDHCGSTPLQSWDDGRPRALPARAAI